MWLRTPENTKGRKAFPPLLKVWLHALGNIPDKGPYWQWSKVWLLPSENTSAFCCTSEHGMGVAPRRIRLGRRPHLGRPFHPPFAASCPAPAKANGQTPFGRIHRGGEAPSEAVSLPPVLRFSARHAMLIPLCAIRARVAELVDALDLESSGFPWGFNSPLSHQKA